MTYTPSLRHNCAVAQSTERIGILGGSFNPIHLGHLVVAQEAWWRYRLGVVQFVPCAHNPLKEDPRRYAADPDRLALLRLALRGDPRFGIDEWELSRGGLSYTVDTLRHYRKLHPAGALYLLAGADAVADLPRWREIEAYPELCTLLVYDRPGHPSLAAGLPPEVEALGLNYAYLPVPQYDVSSTGIRERVRAGQPVEYLVPGLVADYIKDHRLYRETA